MNILHPHSSDIPNCSLQIDISGIQNNILTINDSVDSAYDPRIVEHDFWQ